MQIAGIRINMAFNFANEVNTYFKKTVNSGSLKKLYNNGKSTTATSGTCVYALYLNGKLKKIGKAVYGKGLFTRMSQYYRLTKEGCKKISNLNKNNIQVEYFFLNKNDCWYVERKLQSLAWEQGETQPWEDKTRN